jgi:hypothetical protein
LPVRGLLTRLSLLLRLTRLPRGLLHLLVVITDAAGCGFAAIREGLRSIDIDLDVALDVPHPDDLVVDRSERGEDEIDMP